MWILVEEKVDILIVIEEKVFKDEIVFIFENFMKVEIEMDILVKLVNNKLV